MLRASAGDKYSAEQISAAVELLAQNEGKFPPGRRKTPPSLVTLVQRERMLQAMLKAVSELGYTEFTVNDLMARAGVTQRLYYIHFQGKEECFLVAVDGVAARLRARAEEALLQAGSSWRDRVRAVLAELLRFAVAETDAARALFVVARSVQCAIPRHDKLVGDFAKCIHTWVVEDLGEGPDVSAATGLVGGLEAMFYAKLQSGDTEDLVSHLPKLMYFAVLVYEGHLAALRELE
jgi:AcrR family transcriptional regulator